MKVTIEAATAEELREALLGLLGGMGDLKLSDRIEDSGLHARTLSALDAACLVTWADVAAAGRRRVARMDGIGLMGLSDITAALAERGYRSF